MFILALFAWRSPRRWASNRRETHAQESRPAVLADRIVRPLGARPPGGPANQGLHREQPREGRLGGARGGVPVVKRQSAVESRDDSRLSKPGGLRHARGNAYEATPRIVAARNEMERL